MPSREVYRVAANMIYSVFFRLIAFIVCVAYRIFDVQRPTLDVRRPDLPLAIS